MGSPPQNYLSHFSHGKSQSMLLHSLILPTPLFSFLAQVLNIIQKLTKIDLSDINSESDKSTIVHLITLSVPKYRIRENWSKKVDIYG
jgi:hypothetical protein